MTYHALQILSDDPGSFRWVVLKPTADALIFEEHSVADSNFAGYADALNAGTLALAKADGESYENEAADPVGAAECGS